MCSMPSTGSVASIGSPECAGTHTKMESIALNAPTNVRICDLLI